MISDGSNDDSANLKVFYANRDKDHNYELEYGYVNPIAAAYWHLRDELVFDCILKRFDTLRNPLCVLEIGTGHGHELSKFASLGISPQSQFGIDLVDERLQWAKLIYPLANFSRQDARKLGFPDNSFDVVFQFTCVMHAPNKIAQQSMCQEMARVVRPGGLIVWWDVAPQRWRIIIFKRICQIFSDKIPVRQKLILIKQSMNELVSQAQRWETIRKLTPDYILPISKQDVIGLFPNFTIHATNVGLDYAIWKYMFERSPIFAKIFWHIGVLSSNCFAVAEKQ